MNDTNKLREALELLKTASLWCPIGGQAVQLMLEARIKITQALAASKPEPTSLEDVHGLVCGAPISKPEPQAQRERCHAGRDGDCIHKNCPQLRDNEPAASGRHCPLDVDDDDEPEPQAQAAEPEVVAQIIRNEAGQIRICDANGDAFDMSKFIGAQFITLQSHREAMAEERKFNADNEFALAEKCQRLNEAIAKRDAALDACVEALRGIPLSFGNLAYTEEVCAAITQAQEARKS